MNFADKINHSVFRIIAESAKQINVPAYVVGGFVRDIVLKRSSKDIDIVCVGSGIELAKKVAENTKSSEVSIFKNFGTAMVKVGEWDLEFVGARKESYDRGSRKPVVENGTLEDDQNRRDFTINAMAISLMEESYGELIDPFDGMKDLRRMVVKTPLDPKITFDDDPLRMMRAIRFASQLTFDIAPETFDAIADYSDRIKIVSFERITDELNKIILSRKPSYGFKLLYHANLLQTIFPELLELKGTETKNGMSHKDNFYHTLQVLDNICETTDDLWVRWSAILHDIAKPATKRFNNKVGWTFHGHEDKGARMVPNIFRKMKLPLNEKMKLVQKLVKLHLRPIALVKENITDTAIRRLLFEAGNDIEDLMKLCRADITSKNDTKVKKYIANFDRLEKRIVQVEARDQMRNFQPVITGEIIMETFEMKPSREVGEIKLAIREAILDGKIKNEYDEAFNYMVRVAEKKGFTKRIKN
ncbi:MAG: poly(A) polymerase [Arenicella sp.]|jgi:poly(A) polymerase